MSQLDLVIKLVKMTGYKVYLAGVGLMALGVYEITEGMTEQGCAHLAEGFALVGGRAALAKITGK